MGVRSLIIIEDTDLTFPLSVVDLEVDVVDGEAAVALHHRHAVLAREKTHRLRNNICQAFRSGAMLPFERNDPFLFGKCC